MTTRPNVGAQLRPAGDANPSQPQRPQAPRLAPIDRPAGFLHWLLCLFFKLRFGKVMMPLRVMFPRIPRYAFAHLALLSYFERGVSLPRALRHLLAVRVSRQNRCAFCADAHEAFFRMENHPPELLAALDLPLEPPDQAREAAPLDAATRAALRYADEVSATGTVSDATFDRLREHFDERQVMEVVWVVAFSTYLNAIARPLGLGSDGFCRIVEQRRARGVPSGATSA